MPDMTGLTHLSKQKSQKDTSNRDVMSRRETSPEDTSSRPQQGQQETQLQVQSNSRRMGGWTKGAGTVKKEASSK